LSNDLKKRYCWFHPVGAIATVPLYIYLIRPLRVLLNEHVLLPTTAFLIRHVGEIQVLSDVAETGSHLYHSGSGLAVVLAIPFGLFFWAFLILLLLSASRLRFFLMLLFVHLGAFIAALLVIAIAGQVSVMALHLVPLFQHHLVLAASFAILFFSCRDRWL
jgi:hypothetical protein